MSSMSAIFSDLVCATLFHLQPHNMHLQSVHQLSVLPVYLKNATGFQHSRSLYHYILHSSLWRLSSPVILKVLWALCENLFFDTKTWNFMCREGLICRSVYEWSLTSPPIDNTPPAPTIVSVAFTPAMGQLQVLNNIIPETIGHEGMFGKCRSPLIKTRQWVPTTWASYLPICAAYLIIHSPSY